MKSIRMILTSVLMLAASPALAQSVKISDLPAAASITGTEKLPAAKSGATVSITPNALKTFINSTNQPLDPDLTALAGLSTTADRCTYWTGAASAALYSCSSFSRTLAASADAATWRSALGLSASGADTAYALRANNLSDLASASTARTNLGLGTIATQGAGAVSISGGSITGITDLAVADGGTGSSTASGARSNLGAAASGANADITSINNLTTPLSLAQGGTAAGSASAARTSLGVSATGADTTYAYRANNLSDLASASTARANLSAAASGANGDITSLSALSTPLSTAQGGTGSTAGVPLLAAPLTQTKYVAGRWYPGDVIGVSAVGQALAANTIRLQLIIIRRSITISDLWVRVNTVASGNIQLAIYAADATTELPTGSALVSTASISTAVSGNVSATASLALAPGPYWFAMNSDTSTVVLQSLGTSAWFIDGPQIGSTTLGNVSVGGYALTTPQTFGTWGSLTSATFTEVGGTNARTLWGFKVSVGG